ncbi:Putative transcription factor CBF/NF-Y/archaeal histone domain, histone-fold [Septoria linicola]|uniref:Transcription factor CBF/NF-Y/archaeal histone domain, histone-fold n=1 Tax=Septoria linicola TaxID=215465 RepID=A0A9Q9B6B9_9PEZI|nr:putative transcription factor CBF/NF-Y/archaeal histone domain, histone-fold [Septoria linicola]USW57131.1 Putative transcription factor CBF/NF-Y/archaeal histone domain, histone-fold [Septoria linicola]
MPYNNTPITPSTEVTGTVSLPLARVKKIINTDPDINQCSNNAAFVITVATEMFLQHLVEQAFKQVKSEHGPKPRRNIQYRDVANAVARVENLEFLSDVVPRTMTMKQFKQKAAKEAAPAAAGTENGEVLGKGQGTLDGHVEANGKPAGALADVIDQETEIPASEGAEDSGDEEMQDS